MATTHFHANLHSDAPISKTSAGQPVTIIVRFVDGDVTLDGCVSQTRFERGYEVASDQGGSRPARYSVSIGSEDPDELF